MEQIADQCLLGHGDEINVKVWLPLKDEDWNGRFLGQGGLGWV